MKNIGTVTWITYRNFGTYLQAYALQKVITNLGYKTAVIDDSFIVQEINKKKRTLISRVVILIKSIFDFKYQKSCKYYDSFKKKFIQIDRDPISIVKDKYDCFIIGSDQIWSPINYHPFYFASFTNKKKISYAPSLGLNNYNKNYCKNIASLLLSFSHISVREKQSVDFLKKITLRKDIECVIDPTLLLTSAEWESLTNEIRPIKENYILCYLLSYNHTYITWVKNKSKKENKKLVIISNIKKLKKYADVFYTSGPIEFLTAIKYADYIYTDSFHATIFSILFKKNFIVFKRFSKNSRINQNIRLENLFTMIQINDRFLSEDDLNKDIHIKQIEYDKIFDLIEIKKRESLLFLENSIKF